MRKNIPIATLAILALSAIIQVLNLIGEPTSSWLYSNFNITGWDILYSQPWRMITSSFLHANFLHYLGNMSTLLLVGWRLEQKLGPAKFLGAFFGGMLTAYVLWVTGQHGWLVGISGGVCGIFGLSLIANRQEPWWKTIVADPIHLFYLVFLAVPFLPFFEPWVGFTVANLVHLFGIIYGILFGLAFLAASKNSYWRTAVIVLPLILTALQSFTPLQQEWRGVKLVPILSTDAADCRIKSATLEMYIATPAWFVNESSDPIAMFWLDYEGNPKYYYWVGPSDTVEESRTFLGNAWCFVDTSTGEARKAVIVEEIDQIFTYP